jgi:hypothetical protein
MNPITTQKSVSKKWTAPVIQVIEMKAAQGSLAGTLCDKFGSLSHGTGCP